MPNSNLPAGQNGPRPEDWPESQAVEFRRRTGLKPALQAAASDSHSHLSLNELRQLAETSRRGGAAWNMPAHLAACPLCLEAFDCLKSGLPELRQSYRRRLEALYLPASATGSVGTAGQLRVIRPLWRGQRRLWQVAAAVLVLLAGVAWLYLAVTGPGARVGSGALMTARNQPLVAGAAIPEYGQVVARGETRAVFRDGSEVVVTPDARLKFSRSFIGGARVRLEQGRLDATVARQSRGRRFTVATPLGDVRVIGTRFSVEIESEKVIVYENRAAASAPRRYADRVRAVTVQVAEGAVTVNNRHDRVSVAAGQAAVMREGQPMIEVRGTIP